MLNCRHFFVKVCFLTATCPFGIYSFPLDNSPTRASWRCIWNHHRLVRRFNTLKAVYLFCQVSICNDCSWWIMMTIRSVNTSTYSALKGRLSVSAARLRSRDHAPMLRTPILLQLDHCLATSLATVYVVSAATQRISIRDPITDASNA